MTLSYERRSWKKTTSLDPENSKTTNPKSEEILQELDLFGVILDESHGEWSETRNF